MLVFSTSDVASLEALPQWKAKVHLRLGMHCLVHLQSQGLSLRMLSWRAIPAHAVLSTVKCGSTLFFTLFSQKAPLPAHPDRPGAGHEGCARVLQPPLQKSLHGRGGMWEVETNSTSVNVWISFHF